MNPVQLFELDWMEKYEFGSDRRPRIIPFFSKKSEKLSISHNFRVTNAEESRRERRHASSRARRRRSRFVLLRRRLGSAITLSVSCVGGGSPKVPPAEQRRRCGYRSLERILCVLGVSLGSVLRSYCLKNCDCNRHEFSEAPPPRYAVLWSVGVGAAGAPVAIRRGSRFITSSAIVVDK